MQTYVSPQIPWPNATHRQNFGAGERSARGMLKCGWISTMALGGFKWISTLAFPVLLVLHARCRWSPNAFYTCKGAASHIDQLEAQALTATHSWYSCSWYQCGRGNGRDGTVGRSPHQMLPLHHMQNPFCTYTQLLRNVLIHPTAHINKDDPCCTYTQLLRHILTHNTRCMNKDDLAVLVLHARRRWSPDSHYTYT